MSAVGLTFEKSIKPKAVEEFLDYYVYRRLAALLVPGLIKIKASPNQITTLSLIAGLIGAGLVYKNHFVIGALWCFFAIVLDCCDGQVARLTGQSSPIGRVLDGFFDFIWVLFLWMGIWFNGFFQNQGLEDVFPIMALAGASTAIHCWRFDGIKVKYLEICNPAATEGHLDPQTAMQKLKEELSRFNLFFVLLYFVVWFQSYFFIGKGERPTFDLTQVQRDQADKKLAPVINYWSFLGEGHHNTLLLVGVLLAPLSYKFLVTSFWTVAVSFNLWWLFCEILFAKRYREVRQSF